MGDGIAHESGETPRITWDVKNACSRRSLVFGLVVRWIPAAAEILLVVLPGGQKKAGARFPNAVGLTRLHQGRPLRQSPTKYQNPPH